MEMDKAICWECVGDKYLKEIVKRDGEELECSGCGKKRPAFTVDQLGELIEPILREHLRLGDEVWMSGGWENRGDSLSYWVQEMIGECFGLEDEIADAVVAAEPGDPTDGDPPFFDAASEYVEKPVSLREYFEEWKSVEQELKYKRRFFSSSAKALFDRLFEGVEEMQVWLLDEKIQANVVRMLPKSSELFRARICDSDSLLNEFITDPRKNVGPPPSVKARAGRMNADGVAVFYGATDPDTCLAEMRPPLGGDSAVITLRTTKVLRLLDFQRLQDSGGGEPLSYFQPDFADQAEKRGFRRRLHRLISQPVIPGRESDYLITQTMAEYLAHVHDKPFDGVLFASVQREKGTNIVLFPNRAFPGSPGYNAFPLEYIDGSLRLFTTEMVQYKHREKRVPIAGGKALSMYDPDDSADEE
jgi:hypothetical protein